MAKVRVYELAKELGIEPRVLMIKLQGIGEFARSASSTIEPGVIRKLKAVLAQGRHSIRRALQATGPG
jgi:translation initiation factor IF-2